MANAPCPRRSLHTMYTRTAWFLILFFLFRYILSIFCSFPSVVDRRVESGVWRARARKIHTYLLCFPFVVNHDKLINLIYLLCVFGMCWYLFLSLTHSLARSAVLLVSFVVLCAAVISRAIIKHRRWIKESSSLALRLGGSLVVSAERQTVVILTDC